MCGKRLIFFLVQKIMNNKGSTSGASIFIHTTHQEINISETNLPF